MRVWLAAAICLAFAGCARRGGEAPLPPPLPGYGRWLESCRGRPRPRDARRLMPAVQAEFSREGVPPELAWMAEIESSLDPDAGHFFGHRGLFQLDRATAREAGLRTFLPDQRADPVLSARAVARRLRDFDREFGCWALALAAYNAGERRVARAVAYSHTRYFGIVARDLPASTRRYVPEVLALAAVRSGIPPARFLAPDFSGQPPKSPAP